MTSSTSADRFPLGEPGNRPPPKPDLTPIQGRPHWYTNKRGDPVYVEPPRKAAAP